MWALQLTAIIEETEPGQHHSGAAPVQEIITLSKASNSACRNGIKQHCKQQPLEFSFQTLLEPTERDKTGGEKLSTP